MSAYMASAHPYARRQSQISRPNAAGPLLLAGLCLIALALVWAVAELVPAAQFKDAIVLRDFTLLSRPHVDAVANGLLAVLDPAPFIGLGVLLVAVASMRRRWRVGVAVAFVMALAPLSAELLKPLLAHGHVHLAGVHISAGSWPSGHATAAAALALSAVLVAPARMRPLVAALGSAFAVAVGCCLLILAWHMPSDVLGGYLVAALWMALAVAGLRAFSPRSGRGPRNLGREALVRG